MARFEYTIDENNAISLYDNENRNEDNSPNIFQPFNPRGFELPWEREDAVAWVEKWIDQYEHPEKYPKQVIVEEAEVVEETPVES
jgi:hypothetical protein